MSQMKFANDLEIDRRSYLDIEHGKHLCCTLTLLRYLCYQCDDPVAVLTGCRRILDRYSVPLHPQSNALSKKAEEKEDVGS